MVRHKEASTRGPSKGWRGAGITQMGPSKKEEWTLADGTWTDTDGLVKESGGHWTGAPIRQVGPENGEKRGGGCITQMSPSKKEEWIVDTRQW